VPIEPPRKLHIELWNWLPTVPQTAGRTHTDGHHLLRGLFHSGEFHHELRAGSIPVAERADRAAMKLDQMSRDRQAEAEPRRFARGGRVLLAEPLEDMWQELTVYPVSIILSDDVGVAIPLRDANIDPAAPGCEFDGIVHQIPQHLLQPSRVRHSDGVSSLRKQEQSQLDRAMTVMRNLNMAREECVPDAQCLIPNS